MRECSVEFLSLRMRKEVDRSSVREGAQRLPELRAAAQGNVTAGLCCVLPGELFLA